MYLPLHNMYNNWVASYSLNELTSVIDTELHVYRALE